MAVLKLSTVVTSLGLLSQIATAQYYPRNTALNGTTPRASATTTSSTSESLTTSFSDIRGPFIQAYSSTWTQVIIPTTVGTVMVTVNKATNQTFSTTIYHTDFQRNGSATLLTRTDTDAAGTVTQLVTYNKTKTMTVTYPTNYFTLAPSLTWDAVLPTVVDNSTCCFETATLSPTPSHTPFVEVGNIDTQDPRGWLYTLVGANWGDPHTVLGTTQVSSLWSGQTLSIEYDGCPYTYCQLGVTSVSPASGVQAQPGAILATSTTTISIPSEGGDSTSPTPASSQPASSPATPTAAPETTPTTQSAGNGNTSPENTQQASSTPQNTKVSGAPPQSNPAPTSNFVTAGQTILPGSSITLGSGASTTVVAVQTSGSNTIVVVGGSVSSTLTPAPAFTPAPTIVIGSSTISANSASQFIIEGQTLAPGSTITLGSGTSTTIISLQTSGSNTVLVVGSSSSTVKAPAMTPPPITVGGSVITADSASNYVIAGQTLAPGGSAIVVGGTTLSLAPGGTQLIEGTMTMAESTGLGGIIWSILNGGGTGTTTSAAAGRTGSASSSAAPTLQQTSDAAMIRPFWTNVVISAVLCSVALMWSNYG